MILYRPVGEQELALIRESGYSAFPPRLPEPPIFYLMLNRRHAEEIAGRCNTASGYKGCVTQFEVEDSYISRYTVQTVGTSHHQEYWIPAEELAEFNAKIIGPIRVLAKRGEDTEHICAVQALVANYKKDMKTLVAPDADRSEVCWRAGHDSTFGTYDINRTNRYRILTAIRFSPPYALYEELIRFLFVEEIKALETDSFQGFGDPLNLAAWLLKQVERPEDEELFLRAQNANFDTHFGFAPENLEKMGFNHALDDWDIERCIWFALDLREQECAQALLARWKEQQTQWGRESLQTLCRFEQSLNHLEEELAARRQLFELERESLSDWDCCVRMQKLAKLQIELGRAEDARETLTAILPYLNNIPDWQDVGLGRFFMERCMETILLDQAQSAVLWQWAKPHIKAMKNSMHINLCEKAVRAAKCMGDDRLGRELRKCLEKEQKTLLEHSRDEQNA